MKTFIIHIGLPKTGTTTIQESLFPELHFLDKINYLGTTLSKKYYKTPQFHSFTKHFTNLLWFNKKSCLNLEDYLVSDKANVFSSESLGGLYYIHQKMNRINNPEVFPSLIKNSFSNDVTFKILIVLRNQITRIPSSYAQSYKFYKEDPSKNTLEKFIESISQEKNMFLSFYYDELIKQWANVFGKENITILFFEDFINNQTHFTNELSSLLKVENDLVNSLLLNKHYNKKEKMNDGTYIRYTERLYIIKILFIILKFLIGTHFKNKLKKYLGESLVKHFRFKKELIRAITNQEKEFIFNVFKHSNERLWKEYSVDKEKLIKYNYI